MNGILTELEILNRIAAEYSKQEYEKYKKLHPKTQKKPTDPLFEVKEKPEVRETSNQITKNDHFSIFNKAPNVKIAPAKSIQFAPQSSQDESQSLSQIKHTLSGTYQKKDPLKVWRVNKADGSHYYSLRNDQATFQTLKNQGWDSFPVQEVKQVDEKDLTPPKPKELSDHDLNEIQQTLKKNKIRQVYENKKDAIHAHLKKEVSELSSAGVAISKFVKKQALTEHEKEAVEEASRKIAAMFVSMTLGGHVGLRDLAEHLVVDQVVESASASKSHEDTKSHNEDLKNKPLDENTITKFNFKGLGAKLKDVFSQRKDAIVNHLKNEVNEFKTAGNAIAKFITGRDLSEEDKHSLKTAAKEVAGAVLFSAFGGHVALASVVKYLAIGAVANAVVSRSPMKKSYLLNEIEALMNKVAAKSDQDAFIEMIIEQVTKQLENIENYTPQQLRELAKQIEKSMERDPKIKKTLEEQFGKK